MRTGKGTNSARRLASTVRSWIESELRTTMSALISSAASPSVADAFCSRLLVTTSKPAQPNALSSLLYRLLCEVVLLARQVHFDITSSWLLPLSLSPSLSNMTMVSLLWFLVAMSATVASA